MSKHTKSRHTAHHAGHTQKARRHRAHPQHLVHHAHHPHRTLRPAHHTKHRNLKERNSPAQEEVLEHYTLNADGASVHVEIVKTYLGTEYRIHIPELDEHTAALLLKIRNELVAIIAVSTKELTDIEAFSSIKQRFMDEATRLVKQHTHADERRQKFLVARLLQDMLGLGEIEFLVADATLEEIVLASSKEPIRVYSKKYGWLTTNLKPDSEEEIMIYANTIARRVGRQITVLNPLLDAHLVSGDRINAVLAPINTKGNTITIRKFARDPYTIIDFITNKTCSIDIAVLLWIAIEYEMNVLISGGTASGKTSFLNACMPFIPPNQRILSIEDTRELMLPDFLYWTPLVTRLPNPEGKGEVSMLDLLINALRMRPDRIILGEMRKHEEAAVLFEAMHTGHSVYATVHADSSAETIARLINPPLNIPPNLLRAVNLNIVMFRDRRKEIRRVFQLSEFNVEKGAAEPNLLYRWLPEEDKMVQHNESARFFEDLTRQTGMSQTEITRDLEEKKRILNYLIKNNMRSLNELGKIMNLYYRNREALKHAIAAGDKNALLAS